MSKSNSCKIPTLPNTQMVKSPLNAPALKGHPSSCSPLCFGASTKPPHSSATVGTDRQISLFHPLHTIQHGDMQINGNNIVIRLLEGKNTARFSRYGHNFLFKYFQFLIGLLSRSHEIIISWERDNKSWERDNKSWERDNKSWKRDNYVMGTRYYLVPTTYYLVPTS